MVMIKLTMVVPVYGVENYINKFLDSLEKNLQQGIEVIIIDDGTKDNSGKIADEFASKHPEYITVIHKENGGVSSARNKGLAYAKGEYIAFVDPDDYLSNDYVEVILESISKYDNPDLLFFDYYIGSEEKGFKLFTNSKFNEGVISKELFVREHIKDKLIKGMLWYKIYKTKKLNGLCFDAKIRVYEDFAFETEFVLRIDKICYHPEAIYYYNVREGSLSRTQKVDDELTFFNANMKRYVEYSQRYGSVSICGIIKAAHNVLVKMYKSNVGVETIKYERLIKTNIVNIIRNDDFSLAEKKRCLLVSIGLSRLYYRLKFWKK